MKIERKDYIEVVESLGEDFCAQLLQGVRGSLRPFREVDSQSLHDVLRFLRYHRVIGRVASRLDQDLENSEFGRAVKSLYEAIVERYNRQMHTLSKFIETFCFDMDVVLLKSSYIHAVYRDPWLVEPNGDLDIVVSRPNRLVDRLRKADLQKKSLSWPDPCHEMEVVIFNKTRIELHRYLPIWAPIGNATHGVDLQEQSVSAKTQTEGLDYRILRDRAVYSQFNGTKFFYSSPIIHLLTVISSRYRDSCLYGHANISKPPIRLVEMLDVSAILDRSEGWEKVLSDLVRKFNCYEALRWFGLTMLTWLEDDRLIRFVNSISPSKLQGTIPKLLAGGSWIDLPFQPTREALAHPETKDVLHALGVRYKTLALSSGAASQIINMENLHGENGRALSIGHSALTDLELHFRLEGNVLEIKMPIGGDISPHQEYRAYVEINSSFVEFFGHRTLNYLQLRKHYHSWDRGIGNAFYQEEGYFVASLDLKPFFRRGESTADMVLSIAVPQFPRDSDRGWICALSLEASIN